MDAVCARSLRGGRDVREGEARTPRGVRRLAGSLRRQRKRTSAGCVFSAFGSPRFSRPAAHLLCKLNEFQILECSNRQISSSCERFIIFVVVWNLFLILNLIRFIRIFCEIILRILSSLLFSENDRKTHLSLHWIECGWPSTDLVSLFSINTRCQSTFDTNHSRSGEE